jgi:hypothetical protein
MSKVMIKVQNKSSRDTTLSKMKKELSQRYACYVLITCQEPTSDGKMAVEMDYSGDEALAAFLVSNASQIFDEQMIPSRETR